jgi:hypothetical protein
MWSLSSYFYNSQLHTTGCEIRKKQRKVAPQIRNAISRERQSGRAHLVSVLCRLFPPPPVGRGRGHGQAVSVQRQEEGGTSACLQQGFWVGQPLSLRREEFRLPPVSI